MSTFPDFGACVISLDVELHWGVVDLVSVGDSYYYNLLGVRKAVPQILQVFDEFGIAATWAVVGFLFAGSKQELEQYLPATRPKYANSKLSTYHQSIGETVREDPVHYAPDLIQRIRQTPRQEIGSHTFSHYYCLEEGQNRETFASDVQSAVAIANAQNITLTSMVFPRNQNNPAYEDILLQAGITAYRGNPRAWMYRAAVDSETNAIKRGLRLFDSYLNLTGFHTTKWEHIRQANGLCNIPASFFVRAYSPAWKPLERLRLRRLERSIAHAAKDREIIHLWWHPHNFGRHIAENIAMLKHILRIIAHYQARYGLRSLSMAEVAAFVMK